MSVSAYFRFPRVRRRLYAGPLGPYVDTFIEQLAQRGYSKRSMRTKIRVVAAFSHWLRRHGLGAADVDLACRQCFLTQRKRRGGLTSEDAAALQDLQALLCEQGVTQVPAPTVTLSASESLVQDFHADLLAHRGLAAVTANNYCRIASDFLQSGSGDGPLQTETMTSADVIGFVQRHPMGMARPGRS